MKNLVIISNRNVPYRRDIYEHLSMRFRCTFIFIPDKISKHKSAIESKEGVRGARVLKLEISQIFALWWEMRRANAIINVGLNVPSVVCLVLKGLLKYKLYNWWGGTALSERNISKFKIIFRRINVKGYDGFFAYSTAAKDYLVELGVNSDQVDVIGNNTYNLIKCQKVFKSIDVFNAAFQDSRKNTICLLKAIRLLRDEYQIKLNVVIAGSGPELNNLYAYSEKYELNIHFLGYQTPKEIFNIFKRSRLFVHCATMDQWPQTYNEAQIVGVPCIVTRTSGISDYYLNKNESRCMFSHDNPEELSELIRAIMGNESLYETLKEDVNENVKLFNALTAFEKICATIG